MRRVTQAPPWQRTEPDRFRFRFWADDLTANVYDQRSGETHCLSPLAVELLQLLDAGPGTTLVLATALSEVLGGDEPAHAAVSDELRRLQRIGLIRAAE